MKNILIAFALTLGSFGVTGCSSGTTAADAAAPADMAKAPKPDMAVFMSDCGQPGDKGNDIGVGKFCMTGDDCQNNGKAGLCTHIFDDTVYFCTATCTMNGPANQCGMGASCECQMGGCGCTPNSCIGPTPDMAMSQDGGAGDGGK